MITMIQHGGRIALKNVPEELRSTLYEQTAYFVNGADNSDLFRRGRWDGYKRFFKYRDNSYPVGLNERVKQLIVDFGETYEEKLETTDAQDIITEFNATLRPDYQVPAVEAVLDSPAGGVISVATGGGKTVIAASVIHKLHERTVFMVHTKDLLYQAITELGKFLGPEHIGQVGDGKVEPNDITICTTQTLARYVGFKYVSAKDESNQREAVAQVTPEHKRLVDDMIDRCRVLIWDEVHRVACDMALKVSEVIAKTHYRVGLSASPWRDDGADLGIEAAVGPTIYTVSATKLIELGYLVPPYINIVPIPPLPWNRNMPYARLYKLEVVKNAYRNNKILHYYRDLTAQGVSTLILVQSVEHGKILQELISREYDPIEFLSGRDSTHRRQQTIDELKDGTRVGLIATVIADEGLDIKRLGGIILAGGGKSSTRALQRIGRAVRPFEGKDAAFVVDFDDQHPILHRQALMRQAMYRTEPGFRVFSF